MNDMNSSSLPIAVIGAGPIGLAAAAHLLRRGLKPIVFERGNQISANIREWAHVPLFTPWRSLIDAQGRKLLEDTSWTPPDMDDLPTGAGFLEHYLEPLARVPAIHEVTCLGTEVIGVSRRDADKVRNAGRDRSPFVVRTRNIDGAESATEVHAVIDASGTWATPNPIGADGVSAIGEHKLRNRIWYGIPDPKRRHRNRYAGKRCLIVGSGYSAANVALDLLALKKAVSQTEIVWAIRGDTLSQLVEDHGEGPPSRIVLGKAILAAQEEKAFQLITRFRVRELHESDGKICVIGSTPFGETNIDSIDEIVCTTGQRPDLAVLRELRVRLDPCSESVEGISTLIDPNLHSCYSAPPHGWRELCHPFEPDFFIVGMKSYGRAPTFLAITGYQQVASITAALCGDFEAADDISFDPSLAIADIARVEARVAEEQQ